MSRGEGQTKIELRVRQPNGGYTIRIGTGLLGRAGGLLGSLFGLYDRCAIVTSPVVGSFYGEGLARSLRASGVKATLIYVPDGEAFKTLDSVRLVYDRLIEERLDRRSPILALGGGVIGDLAGFVAATFLRGVPLVQVPTSLLAMVDASIGGKVAVDHPAGKNLIGAFKQPAAVLVDTDVLGTLPMPEVRAGMAEVIKHAIIGDAGLFEELEREAGHADDDALSALLDPQFVARAMRVKIGIVEQDPFEQGIRAHLNLGHTFAHAIEQVSGYRIRHGEAVAVGLVWAARLATRRGALRASEAERIEKMVRGWGLPTRIPREQRVEDLLKAMQSDKKRVGDQWRFVLPRGIGAVEVVGDVTGAEVRAVLEGARE